MGSITFTPNDKIMKIENSLSGLIPKLHGWITLQEKWTWNHRDVSRTQSNIFDRAFIAKIVDD